MFVVISWFCLLDLFWVVGLLVARFVGFVDLLMGLLFVICYFAWVLIIDAVGWCVRGLVAVFG